MGMIIDTPDGARVTFDHLRALNAPESTDTWRSLHHADVIEMVKTACGKYGMLPTNEEYSTGGVNESRFFGIIHFDGLNVGGGHMALGIRNSWDKSMSFGLCAGQEVTVCTNLLFSGVFLALKKHTKGMTDFVLQGLVNQAVYKIQDHLLDFDAWLNGLESYPVPWQIQENLVRQAAQRDVVPKSKAFDLAELWIDRKNTANEAKYESNLRGLHGAITQIWDSKRRNAVTLGDKSYKLTQFIEDIKPQTLVHRRMVL